MDGSVPFKLLFSKYRLASLWSLLKSGETPPAKRLFERSSRCSNRRPKKPSGICPSRRLPWQVPELRAAPDVGRDPAGQRVEAERQRSQHREVDRPEQKGRRVTRGLKYIYFD